MGYQIHFNLILGHHELVSQTTGLMDIIDIICICQHKEKSKTTQETDICVLLSAIYEQEAAKKNVGLR